MGGDSAEAMSRIRGDCVLEANRFVLCSSVGGMTAARMMALPRGVDDASVAQRQIITNTGDCES